MATEGGEWKRIRRNVAFLPMDIIETGILCRLPVKQLLRCKLVCKLWYAVIKTSKFIANHYHHQTNLNRNRPIFVETSDKLLPIVIKPRAPCFSTDGICHNLNYCSNRRFSSVLPSFIKPMVNLDDLSEGGRGRGSLLFSYYLGLPWSCLFVRPVNGFLLLLLPTPNKMAVRCRMAMFNPATRQFRQLSDFKFNNLKDAPCLTENYIFGFGICRTNPHVYKVVLLNLRRKLRDGAVAKVYTVGGGGDGDGDWRMIKAVLPRRFVINYYQFPEQNISMNGKCYWLSNDYAHILVFDMDDEVFQEMNSPIPSVHHKPKQLFNASFSEVCCGDEEGDSVGLFLFESNFVDISILKDKDDKEEWQWIRRIVTCIDRPISLLLNPRVKYQFQFPVTDDAIVLKIGFGTFALYHPKTNTCVQFHPETSLCIYANASVFNFKESLFSVDGGIPVTDRVLKDFSIF